MESRTISKNQLDFFNLKIEADNCLKKNGYLAAIALYLKAINEYKASDEFEDQKTVYRYYQQIGFLYYQNKKYPKAIIAFNEVINHRIYMGDAILAATYLYSGCARYEQKDYRIAVFDFQLALATYKRNLEEALVPKMKHLVTTLLYCSYANLAQGFLSEAKENCDEIFELFYLFDREHAGMCNTQLNELKQKTIDQRKKLDSRGNLQQKTQTIEISKYWGTHFSPYKQNSAMPAIVIEDQYKLPIPK